jgi:hypothetical protein
MYQTGGKRCIGNFPKSRIIGNFSADLEIVAIDIVTSSDCVTSTSITNADATSSGCDPTEDQHRHCGMENHVDAADGAHTEKYGEDSLHATAKVILLVPHVRKL